MSALTQEQLDAMTSDEHEQSLSLLLAYTKMSSLIDAIKATYIHEDRQEIADGIVEETEDETNFDDDTDC